MINAAVNGILGDRYSLSRMISKGSYGSVYKAIDTKNNNAKVAIKVIKDGYSVKSGLSSSLVREISMMNMLRNHPYIACLIEVLINKGPGDGTVALIVPLSEYDLSKWIANKEYTLQDVQRIMFQIISAVNFMHSNYIIHRDIKPSNCLIDSDGKTVKVTDFGLSRVINDERNIAYSWPVGTTQYCAPEILLNSKKYNYAIDIWALGTTFAELMGNGNCLFENNHMNTEKSDDSFDGEPTLIMIFELLGKPTCNDHPHLYDLLQVYTSNIPMNIYRHSKIEFDLCNDDGLELLMNMLELEPNDRIKTEIALQSPFFRDVDKTII